MASVPGSDCSEIRLLLSVLADGEATPEETARAEAHVASCAACASHLAFLRLTGHALRQMPDAYPPSDLATRIAAATYERPTLSAQLMGWLRPAPIRAVAGALVAAGLAAVFLLPRIGTITPNVPVAKSGEATISPAASPAASAASGTARTSTARSSGAAAQSAVPPVAVATAAAPRAAAPQSKARAASAATPLPPARASLSAPLRVAVAARPKSVEGIAHLSGGAATAAAEIAPILRGIDAPVDRHLAMARGVKPAAAKLRKARGGAILPPRSGYDRAIATLGALHGPEMASGAPVGVAPTPAAAVGAPAPQPRVMPTPYAVAEQPSPKTIEGLSATAAVPSSSVASSAASGSEPRVLHFSFSHRRISNDASIDIGDAKRLGAVRSSANESYGFNRNPSQQTSVVTADADMH